MKSLELKIPPLILAVLFALLMWLLSIITPGLNITSGVTFAVASAFAVAGLAFCLCGVLHFRKVRTTVNPTAPSAATALVSSGIYTISRNPMYVGFLLLLLSWALFLSNAYTLVAALLFIPYLNRFQIVPEERALQTLFGVDYTAYRNRVRRWL